MDYNSYTFKNKVVDKLNNDDKKKRTVVKYTTKDGTKIKSVERRSGKRVETAKNKAKDFKSRQVTGKDGNIKKTVTRTNGGVEKEIERGKKRRVVSKGKI